MRGVAWRAATTDAGIAYRDCFGALDLPLPTLPGTHQADNATLAVANTGVKSNLERLSVETQSVRKQRSEALAALDQAEDYLALEVYPSQYEVLTTALNLVKDLGVKIPEWTYDVGTLSFTLRTPRDIDPTFLITAFERSGAFTNVTAARVGQDSQIRVRMDVLPRQLKAASK